jgi:protein-disulfide isomerase
LPRIRLLAALLAICIAVGCKAQSTPPQTTPQSPQDYAALTRRIQVMIRSQFNIPPDYSVSVGTRKPSKIAGYDTLPVVFSHGSNETDEEFLISTDNKTLAHLDKFDLANDPASSIDVSGRFVYKDYPLIEIHNWAMHAAVDANCLATQSTDAYWKYVDYLHNHGQEISGPDRNSAKSFDALNRIAREQGTLAKVDSGKLDGCLAAQDESNVRASLRLGDTLKIQGAPALFINGERIDGALPQEQVWLVIDRALRAAGIEPPPLPPPPAPHPAGTSN